MPYDEQDNKWFSMLIFTALPFYVIYKWFRGSLPHISGSRLKDKK
jgi:hypothetical protein